MNYLHDMIDSVQAGNLVCDYTGKPEDLKIIKDLPRLKDMFFDMAYNSQCFDMGEIEYTLSSYKLIAELFLSPYSSIWLNGKLADGGILGVFMTKTTEDFDIAVNGNYTLWIFNRRPDLAGVWTHVGACTYYAEESVVRSEQEELLEYHRDITSIIGRFLSALNCQNIKSIEHKAPTLINRKRARKGKTPLYSYWTLELDGKHKPTEGKGGEHESPRLHLRRGHIREYSKGLFTWVTACVVGNSKNGVIEKDYKLKSCGYGANS